MSSDLKLQTPSFFLGPILGFNYENQETREMGYKVVVGLKGTSEESLESRVNSLFLTFSLQKDEGASLSFTIKPEFLACVQDVTFYRFCFSVPIQEKTSLFTYQLLNKSYNVTTPGFLEERMIDFCSCNDLQTEEERKAAKDKDHMWRRYQTMIEQKIIPHMFILGGDQGYFDDVWKTEEITKWLNIFKQSRQEAVSLKKGDIDPKTQKIKIDFEKMQREIESYYLKAYRDRFSSDNDFGKMLSVIATWMSWDDHDIFDGAGSYPEDIEKSAVVKLIKKVAKRMYFIVQQQSSPKKVQRINEFIGKGSTKAAIFGSTAILSPDTRSFRTLNQIIDLQDWQKLMDFAIQNQNQYEHLLLVLPIPLVYFDMNIIRKATAQAEKIIPGSTLAKLPFTKSLVNMFELYELNDDLDDHWDNPNHEEEKRKIISGLLLLKSMGKSVLIVSGDVHHGCETELRSTINLKDEEDPNLLKIAVSSAMVNIPSFIGDFLSKLFSTDPKLKDLSARITSIKPETPNQSEISIIASQNFLRIAEVAKKGLSLVWHVFDPSKTTEGTSLDKIIKYRSFNPIGPKKE